MGINQQDLNDIIMKSLDVFDPVIKEVAITLIVRVLDPKSTTLDSILTSEDRLVNIIPYLEQVLTERPLFPKGLILPDKKDIN